MGIYICPEVNTQSVATNRKHSRVRSRCKTSLVSNIAKLSCQIWFTCTDSSLLRRRCHKCQQFAGIRIGNNRYMFGYLYGRQSRSPRNHPSHPPLGAYWHICKSYIQMSGALLPNVGVMTRVKKFLMSSYVMCLCGIS
jgi:hypothetical protein